MVRTVRHGKALRQQMLADLEHALGQLDEAHALAHGNPKVAELLIRAAQGDLERLRGRINGEMMRMLQYASHQAKGANMPLEQRVDALEVETAQLRARIEERTVLMVRPERNGWNHRNGETE